MTVLSVHPGFIFEHRFILFFFLRYFISFIYFLSFSKLDAKKDRFQNDALIN